MFGEFFAYLFFSAIGRIYLFFRFFNIEKMEEVVKEKYGSDYATVGQEIAFTFFFLMFGLLLGGLLLVGIFAALFR